MHGLKQASCFFIAEAFVELFGLFDGLLVINVNASLLNLFF